MRHIYFTILMLLMLSMTNCSTLIDRKEWVDEQGQQHFSLKILGNAGIGTEVPPELKDFPVPAGFRFSATSSINTGTDGKMVFATWMGQGGDEKVSTVTSFYENTLVEQGWQPVPSSGLPFGPGAVPFVPGIPAQSYQRNQQQVNIQISKRQSSDVVDVVVSLRYP